MDVRERLAALRAQMHEQGLAAYVVPGNDPHASEYMASHWCEMQWLSGFNGESGTMVVTTDRALLWTDSRYYLQAGIELKDSTIELMRESDIDCLSVVEWLKGLQVTGYGLRVGLNPEMFSVNDFKAWKEQFAEAGIGKAGRLSRATSSILTRRILQERRWSPKSPVCARFWSQESRVKSQEIMR